MKHIGRQVYLSSILFNYISEEHYYLDLYVYSIYLQNINKASDEGRLVIHVGGRGRLYPCLDDLQVLKCIRDLVSSLAESPNDVFAQVALDAGVGMDVAAVDAGVDVAEAKVALVVAIDIGVPIDVAVAVAVDICGAMDVAIDVPVPVAVDVAVSKITLDSAVDVGVCVDVAVAIDVGVGIDVAVDVAEAKVALGKLQLVLELLGDGVEAW